MNKVALVVLMIIITHFVLFGPLLYVVAVYDGLEYWGHVVVTKAFKGAWRQHFYYMEKSDAYASYGVMFYSLAQKTIGKPIIY